MRMTAWEMRYWTRMCTAFEQKIANDLHNGIGKG